MNSKSKIIIGIALACATIAQRAGAAAPDGGQRDEIGITLHRLQKTGVEMKKQLLINLIRTTFNATVDTQQSTAEHYYDTAKAYLIANSILLRSIMLQSRQARLRLVENDIGWCERKIQILSRHHDGQTEAFPDPLTVMEEGEVAFLLGGGRTIYTLMNDIRRYNEQLKEEQRTLNMEMQAIPEGLTWNRVNIRGDGRSPAQKEMLNIGDNPGQALLRMQYESLVMLDMFIAAVIRGTVSKVEVENIGDVTVITATVKLDEEDRQVKLCYARGSFQHGGATYRMTTLEVPEMQEIIKRRREILEGKILPTSHDGTPLPEYRPFPNPPKGLRLTTQAIRARQAHLPPNPRPKLPGTGAKHGEVDLHKHGPTGIWGASGSRPPRSIISQGH
jgi:hypothetical protein